MSLMVWKFHPKCKIIIYFHFLHNYINLSIALLASPRFFVYKHKIISLSQQFNVLTYILLYNWHRYPVRYYKHTYVSVMYQFYTIGNFSEFRTDGRTIPISDRNGVPIRFFGNSDKIGILSEFCSEGATKISTMRSPILILKICQT